MSLAPCFGVLLLCAQALGQAVGDAPHAAPTRAVDASYSEQRAEDAPLAASLSSSMPVTASEAIPRQPAGATEGSAAAIAGPEPGLLLLAGSLTVWFALSRRRAGTARA